MKKIIALAAFLCVVSMSFGQNKWQQKKIDYFVEAAAKEFKLDKKQTTKLSKVRTTYFLEYMEIVKKAKSGAITQEEKKSQINAHNQKFNTNLKAITGTDNVQPFLVRMRNELKNVK
ncbi:hypothetical protein [Seonamhaeicola marinus]|uniref:DUF4168 domain-containing protein n=1 Tax=Seonamhaeicola marinus TaxID=1912246 RepID=A0A5D0J982_9FLAO|nr:hypothetical protein [Seonamhaeicola marinus]TYA92136.1 hypothetical protein FUA24_01515 [Seonamhaeicola marinus]